jgi:hypothetical protein
MVKKFKPRKASMRLSRENTFMHNGMELLKQILELNKLPFRVFVELDLAAWEFGYYKDEHSNRSSKIYINPISCNKDRNYGNPGHPDDTSEQMVIIHELGHLIVHDNQDILEDYEDFVYNRDLHFLPTDYARTNNKIGMLEEELVEIMAIYFINPYIIKVADPEVFNWLSERFITPIKPSATVFKGYWNKWSARLKTKFEKAFMLTVKENKISKISL